MPAPPGPRHVATAVEVDFLCEQLLLDPPPLVGLDIEWRPTYK
jgi:hypothetical protein